MKIYIFEKEWSFGFFSIFDKLGNYLVNLGLFIMPISFLAYALLKFIELARRPQVRYTKLYKILWLSLQFIVEFSFEKKYIIVIILLILLDIVDTFFEFIEEAIDAQEMNRENS